ncbi:glycoside hydrolase family 20 zincin-like fold domain-containing protein [Streptomyces nigra]|uniref:glycoside hydrolase family 20 zincin-like fold domain-containing protein n=1 Tax=Streptomyces nigra TaxID=1827580 RepID=UPI003644EE0C
MRRRWRAAGVLAAPALVLTAPLPAAARQEPATPTKPAAPVTVPALTDWTPAPGHYRHIRTTRLVADGPEERRVAGTRADDLRAAGHGTVPVVRGGARTGDIVIDVRPDRTSLGTEGYELRSGARLSVTAATETGAFYGTSTVLQLLG